uniref:Uncharacterized protein n=1 Tax=Leersia perrieri TaxID=77586 RepID=A0A0D9W9P4_9ORYZ
MDLPEFVIKIMRAIADACLDDNKLPGALISCGVLQAAAALSLIFFIAPGGIFGHHGKGLHWLYYGSLVTVVVVGFVEASLGFWVAGDVVNRRALGRTVLLVCLFSLIFVIALWGYAAAAIFLAFFKPPGGLFEHHGKTPVCIYYSILGGVAVFGFAEASAGFWISGRLVERRAVGRTFLCQPANGLGSKGRNGLDF